MMTTDLPREKLAFPIPELAQTLGISRSLLYEEMASGRLGYIKIGKRRLVTADQVTAYLRSLERAA